jgi:excisionase family DNA binding protein
MSLQEKNQIKMNYKERLQIESVNSDDYKKSILDGVALILEKCNCCNEQQDKKEEEWYTAKEVCKKLKISLPTLKKSRENGEIKYHKYGRAYRYVLSKE